MLHTTNANSERPGPGHKTIGGLATRWRLIVLLAAAGGALAIIGLSIVRKPYRTPVMRGQELATSMGCVGCHGPSHMEVRPNPGSAHGEIPPFGANGTLSYFVQSESEIKEWILFGAPRRLLSERNGLQASRDAGVSDASNDLISMPQYEGFVSEQQLDDLVEYVKYVAKFEEPSSPKAVQGRQVAERNGCFACHGIDGRGALANPGSFKGLIPPWDGQDFLELVRDEEELRQWLNDGMIDRFEANPLATYFTDRQVIKMPPYRHLLEASEVDALVAYILWLRDEYHETATPFERPAVTTVSTRVERGAWLFQRSGCSTCHGADGRGGVPNENAVGGFVPALNILAERVGLYEEAHAQIVVDALEAGHHFEDREAFVGVPDYEFVLGEYRAMRDVILGGERATRKDDEGPDPPMRMPSWDQRLHADHGPISEPEIDALVAYLLTLQPWEE